jgi:PiT family inorganic phosphate transporter
MGVITLGLVAAGVLPAFEVPLWVIRGQRRAIALGTLFGGWRLIRTLGGRFYRLRPIHGLGAQGASTIVILGAALLGGRSAPPRSSARPSSGRAARSARAWCAGASSRTSWSPG